SVALVHDTPRKFAVKPADGRGAGDAVHAVPSHPSIALSSPVAMQNDLPTHDTPVSDAEIGLGTTAQVDPFQRSMSP
ncbi:MAG TPA: hypothetical protein VGP92_13975, partial [Acidimicrobiia bacterium]|nr:hypothetical protein [Acidimicrobiia bacterium]